MRRRFVPSFHRGSLPLLALFTALFLPRCGKDVVTDDGGSGGASEDDGQGGAGGVPETFGLTELAKTVGRAPRRPAASS